MSISHTVRRLGAALAGATVAGALVLAVPAPSHAVPTRALPGHLRGLPTRLVGAHGVVIAVPRSWRQTPQPLCPGLDRHPYYDLTERVRIVVPCPAVLHPVPVSHLDVGRNVAGGGLGPHARTADVRRLPGGGRLVTVDRCDRRECDVVWRLGAHRVFAATLVGRDRRLVAPMTRSIHRIGARRTTVPLWPIVVTHPSRHELSDAPMPARRYLRVLRRAGLRGRLVGDHRSPYDQGRVTNPPQGRVVRRGTVVLVHRLKVTHSPGGVSPVPPPTPSAAGAPSPAPSPAA